MGLTDGLTFIRFLHDFNALARFCLRHEPPFASLPEGRGSVFAPPGDPALREVVRAHFQLDGIAGNDADVVHAQLARDVRRDDVPVG